MHSSRKILLTIEVMGTKEKDNEETIEETIEEEAVVVLEITQTIDNTPTLTEHRIIRVLKSTTTERNQPD